jgi:hypothetical protein
VKWTICIDNEAYEASLAARKLYEILDDDKSDRLGFIRVIDESGGDYLYPKTMFEPIEISRLLESRLLLAA